MPTRRLIINTNEQGRLFLFVDGKTVTIGDDPESPMVFEQLRVVRIRCELEVEGDHITCRKDADGAGEPREIAANKLLRAGVLELHLEAPLAQEPDSEEPVLAESEPEPASEREGLGKRLVVIDGADLGKAYPLPQSGKVSLGKDRKHTDITLHDLYVSRVHCLLEMDEDTVEVVDDGGHGVQVNGKKVTRQSLNLGDVLRIGNSHLRLEAALPGEEVGRVAGEDPEGEAISVADPRAADEEQAVVDEEPEEPPENASERVKLLHSWRTKLAKFVGQTFGHYRIGRVLGRGRCGVVFRADDLKTKQVHALKVFSPQFPYSTQELQRFAGGMKGILPLRHPHQVTVFGAGKTGIYTWIAREHIAGESVLAVMRRQAQEERYNERRACRVAIHVTRALDFAKKHRFRHGSISPANILIQESDKSVKLADLMLSVVLEESLLWEAVLEYRSAEDVSYLSPEQATPGAFVDELSDVYSLGAVVYALLTGRPPFVGDTAEAVLEQLRGEARVPRPTSLNGAITASMERVVLRMLSRRQEDRHQSPAELLAELEAVAAKEGFKV